MTTIQALDTEALEAFQELAGFLLSTPASIICTTFLFGECHLDRFRYGLYSDCHCLLRHPHGALACLSVCAPVRLPLLFIPPQSINIGCVK